MPPRSSGEFSSQPPFRFAVPRPRNFFQALRFLLLGFFLLVCDPLIVPNQIHALFLRVSFPGFSDRRSRPFRINVVITLAVRERMYLHTSLHRPAPYGTIESRGARYVPP